MDFLIARILCAHMCLGFGLTQNVRLKLDTIIKLFFLLHETRVR